MKKVDVLQVLISSSAIFGISLVWYYFDVKVFHTVRYLLSAMVYDINFMLNNFFILSYSTMSSDNKLVKTITDASVLTGLVAGIGWIAKKVVKENFTSDPSSNAMNYVKFTAVMAGSIALKQYPEDQKIIPSSM